MFWPTSSPAKPVESVADRMPMGIDIATDLLVDNARRHGAGIPTDHLSRL